MGEVEVMFASFLSAPMMWMVATGKAAVLGKRAFGTAYGNLYKSGNLAERSYEAGGKRPGGRQAGHLPAAFAG